MHAPVIKGKKHAQTETNLTISHVMYDIYTKIRLTDIREVGQVAEIPDVQDSDDDDDVRETLLLLFMSTGFQL